MKHPIFQIKKLKLKENGKSLLDIRKLEIHRGSCYVFYGDIGSGKTTLLDLLSRNRSVPADHVFFEKDDLSKISSTKYSQETHYVHQSFKKPWFGVTVKNYMYKKIKSYNHLTNHKKKLNDIINKMNLTYLLKLDLRKLSDGERRWVELALAIACDTKVLFIDGFGQFLSSEKINVLSKILYKKINYDGVTVIVSTHIRERLSKIASVFIRLDRGNIVSVRSHKKNRQRK